MKKFLKTVLIFFMCTLTFLGVAYMYLGYNFKRSEKAGQNEIKVPYRQVPQNKGILLVFPSGSGVLAFLNFDTMGIDLLSVKSTQDNKTDYGGYPVDYTVKMNYTVIAGVVDRVGGVNLENEGKKVRYTGTQTVDLISGGCDSELRNKIIYQVFSQMSKNGLSKNDFVFVLQNSKTDLSVVDCIAWAQYVGDMCGKARFITD